MFNTAMILAIVKKYCMFDLDRRAVEARQFIQFNGKTSIIISPFPNKSFLFLQCNNKLVVTMK